MPSLSLQIQRKEALAEQRREILERRRERLETEMKEQEALLVSVGDNGYVNKESKDKGRLANVESEIDEEAKQRRDRKEQRRRERLERRRERREKKLEFEIKAKETPLLFVGDNGYVNNESNEGQLANADAEIGEEAKQRRDRKEQRRRERLERRRERREKKLESEIKAKETPLLFVGDNGYVNNESKEEGLIANVDVEIDKEAKQRRDRKEQRRRERLERRRERREKKLESEIKAKETPLLSVGDNGYVNNESKEEGLIANVDVEIDKEAKQRRDRLEQRRRERLERRRERREKKLESEIKAKETPLLFVGDNGYVNNESKEGQPANADAAINMEVLLANFNYINECLLADIGGTESALNAEIKKEEESLVALGESKDQLADAGGKENILDPKTNEDVESLHFVGNNDVIEERKEGGDGEEKTLNSEIKEDVKKSSNSVGNNDVKEESKEEKGQLVDVDGREKIPDADVKEVGTSASDSTRGGPRFTDIGGMEELLLQLKREVILPLNLWGTEQMFGMKPPSGILLHGPPGCGKTTLARAIATEARLPFQEISATALISSYHGKSEANIRDAFAKARSTAPSILFIDEIDAIASKREENSMHDRRIVIQLMNCMDESNRLLQHRKSSDFKHGYVLVIAATNFPDAIDVALRRPGRFDKEICLGVPEETSRLEILSLLTGNLKLEASLDLMHIARSSSGFVGADLSALVDKARDIAADRMIHKFEQMLSRYLADKGEDPVEWCNIVKRQPWYGEESKKFSITMADFEKAAKTVQASSKREGFSSVPNVKWEDVGGLDNLRDEFVRDVIWPLKYPEAYAEFGVDKDVGILLYGPPGCGKTLIAKAVANESGTNFIYIKGPELLDKYHGESEKAVRTLFSRARKCSPCILFFDEVDSLTQKRGKSNNPHCDRVLNQLLIELDGADERQGVFIIGATNRLDTMDAAALRPGRFGKHLYVPLPSAQERGSILKALARKKPIDPSVDLEAIAKMNACDNFSGADLAALVNEAAKVALEENLFSEGIRSDESSRTIKTIHFQKALSKIPSKHDG